MKQLLGTGLLAFGLGHLAFGAVGLELELTDGTNTALIDSGGALHLTGAASGTATVNLAIGVFTFNGAVGNYSVNVSTGEGAPLLTQGSLDLNTLDTSSAGGGPLKIWWSENGITATNTGWQMILGGTLSTGAGGNVSYTAYEDNTNAFFGTQNTIATLGPLGSGIAAGITSGGVAVTLVPHSLSQLITLNGVGATNLSTDAAINPTPEPASVVLFGGVVLAIATAIRRKALNKG